ncbi:ArsR/SmtB family transcription factor [Thermoproteota archaeon]
MIKTLIESPQNAHQLSQELSLDYSTIRHHLEVLEKNKLVTSIGDSYGKMYFPSDSLIDNYDFFLEIWEKIGKKVKKKEVEEKMDERE